MEREKSNKKSTLKTYALGLMVTLIGFVVIPPLIDKIGSRLYKSTIHSTRIDFDNLGPDIVPKE